MSNQQQLDRSKGCLIGGAVGDALGYPVEFDSINSIISKYGIGGITEYTLTNNKAVISDDTQMELFTAEGLLQTPSTKPEDYITYIYFSYINWYLTQKTADCKNAEKRQEMYNEYKNNSPLMELKQLYKLRAPGNTCLVALSKKYRLLEGSTTKASNNSKGCGGIMRVSSIGIYFSNPEQAAYISSKASELTHGHLLSSLSSALLSYTISSIIYENKQIKQALKSGMEYLVSKHGETNTDLTYLISLIVQAIKLSENNISDIQNIEKLGQGWVAEETLALAVYFSLRYQDNFNKAIISSVNHSGDSDSVGKVTGSILGAYLGLKGISEKFIYNLELKDIIEQTAENLFNKHQ